MTSPAVMAHLWGPYACFTRPEFKVERVSYPVITPSAARGALEAIYWHPEFRYEIRRIGVVKLGTEAVILRNEVDARMGRQPFDIESHRQQRSSLVLQNVEYLIGADLVLQPHADAPLAKYLSQIERRLARGQCHHTPYLGCREFAASFAAAGGIGVDGSLTRDLGLMLFDLAYVPSSTRAEFSFRVHGTAGARETEGYAEALFFKAQLTNGWIEVPRELYAARRGKEGGGV